MQKEKEMNGKPSGVNYPAGESKLPTARKQAKTTESEFWRDFWTRPKGRTKIVTKRSDVDCLVLPASSMGGRAICGADN